MTALCECGCGDPAPIATQSSTRFGWVRGQPMRFRVGHYARTVTEGRWAKEPLEDKYRVDPASGCWVWQRATQFGYAIYRPTGAPTNVRGHRYMYELLVGPIPEGLQLDHLCRNRACVNPAHLEPVTARVNTLRSTAISARNATLTSCKRGHPFNEANTYCRNGRRHCRTCRRMQKAA